MEGTVTFAPVNPTPSPTELLQAAIARAGDQLIVSWPGHWTDSRMEVCETLCDRSSWVVVPQPAALVGDRYQARMTWPGTARFFRVSSASATGSFPGEIIKSIAVPVYGDAKAEADETFSLVVSQVSNATATNLRATAVIENDDLGPACEGMDMSVTQEVQPNPGRVDEDVTCVLTVERTVECPGREVVVTDLLPEGARLISASAPQGNWYEAAGILTFQLGALAEVRVGLSLTLRPTAVGVMTNVVEVWVNAPEQNLRNNRSEVEIPVLGRDP